jgi:hypothetical protein
MKGIRVGGKVRSVRKEGRDLRNGTVPSKFGA